MTSISNAVASSKSMKHTSRNVNNSKVSYMLFMLAAFKIYLPVFLFFLLVCSFTPYRRTKRVMTVNVMILL